MKKVWERRSHAFPPQNTPGFFPVWHTLFCVLPQHDYWFHPHQLLFACIDSPFLLEKVVDASSIASSLLSPNVIIFKPVQQQFKFIWYIP